MTAPPATSSPTPAATVSPVTLPAGEKIYVVNHGVQGDNPSVTIYPVAAAAASTPVATLAGSNTELGQPFFDAVDAAGTLYVSNQSNNPGSPTSGYVTEYSAMGQSGNQPPLRTITGLDSPNGVAVDAQGNLYVGRTLPDQRLRTGRLGQRGADPRDLGCEHAPLELHGAAVGYLRRRDGQPDRRARSGDPRIRSRSLGQRRTDDDGR